MAAKPGVRPHDAVRHPLFARFYARLSVLNDEHGGVGSLRDELLAGLSGRVIEIGAGNGLNFARYPETVGEVAAVEPERHMRQLAAEAALRARVPVDVLAGTAEALPVADASFDAAVVSLVLCSLGDVPRALSELRRVLRPGGELRFFEHGVADGRPGMAAAQRLVDKTVWPLLFGGCHTGRDPLGGIAQAGFTDPDFRRVRIPERGPALPHSFHVLGRARSL
ncbi:MULTISPECIES: class I SAM-dependent methyltransferase [unclassified Streptomyces]|uniref:class I SAM-dependent methyltransferase n=1 Tax=unclassified Streptomyces TaxID=2593676 RepID=UPI002DD99F52|nr:MULTISPECIES: class I SAM-dependent methyltransferase [unclassified Streptomyces]WSA96774.1 class I SAM-dependent methyltransferase [Streptomyces sp. NBC_01795]WSS10601.1 class I SAM-dependent methyltransferase [Streptomyces sp. NBC_01186]WSS39295.1 class I SAM-dependent methyltransferase [Streptomyces sp. NBC_01187]